MKYRIGEVAELFSMTKGGIRYLEKRGLICSQRDEKNGYRYYDRNQITFIKRLRYYQALGFSLEEAGTLIECGDSDYVLENLQRMEGDLSAQLEKTVQTIKALKTLARKISSASTAAADWEKSTRPAMYRISVWEDIPSGVPTSSMSSDFPSPESEEERKQAESSFISHIPDTSLSLLVRRQNDRYQHVRGSCIEKNDADRLGVFLNNQVDYYPEDPDCYYAIIKSSNLHVIDSVIEQVKIMEDIGENLNGDIIGRVLLSKNIGDEFDTYFEFWIPFAKT